MTRLAINSPTAIQAMETGESVSNDRPVFFVDTNLSEFLETARPRCASPFFDYWLRHSRLYVTVGTRDYERTFKQMVPGSVVFAYESMKGIVARGIVADRPDRQEDMGGTELHPNPKVTVKSIAVMWNPTVTLDYRVASRFNVPANGPALRNASPAWRALLADRMPWAASIPSDETDDAVEAGVRRDPAYSYYERIQIVNARRGQGVFRENVLALEPACRVTQVADPLHLIASHIKPWRHCEGLEHIDGHNGLMLTPNADHLFDAGLISFDDSGRLLVSSNINVALIASLGFPRDVQPKRFSKKQKQFLFYHRRHIFRNNEI